MFHKQRRLGLSTYFIAKTCTCTAFHGPSTARFKNGHKEKDKERKKRRQKERDGKLATMADRVGVPGLPHQHLDPLLF